MNVFWMLYVIKNVYVNNFVGNGIYLLGLGNVIDWVWLINSV